MTTVLTVALLGAFGFCALRFASRLQTHLDREDARLEEALDEDAGDEDAGDEDAEAKDSGAPDRPPPIGGECPECGEEIDPELGFCEDCLHSVVRRQEERERRRIEETDPDPSEEREVARIRAFLEAPHDDKDWHCPNCLCELVEESGACRECNKPALPMVDLRPHLEQLLQDITSGWFAPVADSVSVVRFGELVDALEDSEPRFELCVRQAHGRTISNYSATLVLKYRKCSILFVKRKQLPRLRTTILDPEFLFGMSDETRSAVVSRIDQAIQTRPTARRGGGPGRGRAGPMVRN